MMKEIVGFPDYYVSSDGKIYKLKITQKDGAIVKPVNTSYTTNGFKKVNMKDEAGKLTSKCVHNIVYEAFKTDRYSALAFIDGDKTNCRLENIVSLEVLLEFYKTHNML